MACMSFQILEPRKKPYLPNFSALSFPHWMSLRIWHHRSRCRGAACLVVKSFTLTYLYTFPCHLSIGSYLHHMFSTIASYCI
jgi:hypothetical protein